ncbi:DUF2251 domain-containing protein [Noviluteimonas gilva]|uniref:DUF2251 domain-containing protein n=1 Tax=Noviluteimonas gilva TaxID=2682097 RepID=A0A7C9LMT5_9GAMM|nr:DUF2251 domain-containing protein [Lysobacter gilvus]MUV15284.1 DUF2251 domain-containing protein [Lysobacter gilvus]
MDEQEIFESEVRSNDDLAGVFEHDGDTGYFYLYDLTKGESQRIIAALHMMSGTADFSADEVAVRWDQNEQFVGLLIKGKLWAAFEAEGSRPFDGGYGRVEKSEIPENIRALFEGKA